MARGSEYQITTFVRLNQDALDKPGGADKILGDFESHMNDWLNKQDQAVEDYRIEKPLQATGSSSGVGAGSRGGVSK